ncbi:MAG: hypothetical protein KGH54_03085 [Candidatus Micrarchaeota archaeon]|nr:hypothetical protein [Candidatus Micrarchaeota archaeon]
MSHAVKNDSTPAQKEIEAALLRLAQLNFRSSNIVVEMKYFGDWGYPNQLIKVLGGYLGTTTRSDVIDIGKRGVTLSRLEVGCFSQQILGSYELSWEKIEHLIRTEPGTFRDGPVVISKKDLHKLLELRGKYVEGSREEESLRRL